MKIISYNINGIRSAMRTNFSGWVTSEKPDILCLQEVKSPPDQMIKIMFEMLGYKTYWHPAQRKGYSGVAILTLEPPINVQMGFGHDTYDGEGRVLRADFDDFTIFSVYFPNGGSGEVRQEYKMQFLDDFYSYIEGVLDEQPNIIISGDINICHTEMDIHDPIRNATKSGFLPDEREWFDDFLDLGFIDSWRLQHPDDHDYTWWSWRANARDNNKGWRLDYHLVSKALKSTIGFTRHMKEAMFSDHCPVLLELR